MKRDSTQKNYQLPDQRSQQSKQLLNQSGSLVNLFKDCHRVRWKGHMLSQSILFGVALAAGAIAAPLPTEALNFTMMDDLDEPGGGFFYDTNGPGGTIARNEYESDSVIFFFKEVTNLTLAADVAVDASIPGANYNANNTNPGIVAAGTSLDSYYFSFDPATDPAGAGTIATINFDYPILGLIFLDDPPSTGFPSLDNTNATFARPGITYPFDGSMGPNDQFIGVESDPGLTWAIDGRTLTFNVAAGSFGVDNVRVLVVPFEFSPTYGLVALGAIAVGWHWRKRITASITALAKSDQG
jgi:hypothetical protein